MPLGKPAGNIALIREKLYDLMWDDVGIVRDAASLTRAEGALDQLEAELDATGIAEANLAFNLTWHDWLNLKSLLLVSKSIRFAAMAREDSRGAHFRADFPGRARSRELALHVRHVERRPLREHDAAGDVHARETGRDAARRAGPEPNLRSRRGTSPPG